MPMSPAEMERKVRQLDNDVQWIYSALSSIQGTQERHTNRFAELAERLDGFDGRLTSLDGRVHALDGRVHALAGEVHALDGKVDALAGEVHALDGKVDALDGKVHALDGKVDAVTANTETILELLRRGSSD